MMITHVKVPMSNVAKDITVNVEITGMTRFRIQVWIGSRIIRFGAWIIGCKVDIRIAP